MATISKSKHGTYRAQIRRTGQTPVSKSFKSRQEAEIWARMTESELDRGIYVNRSDAERITLAELFQRYLIEVSLTKKGYKQERIRLLKIQNIFGHYRVLQLQSKHIAAYRDARIREGKSPSTILNELSLISQVIDTAIKEWSIPIPINPCKFIKKPKVSNGRNRRLNDHEERSLLTACKASRAPLLYPLVIIAIETAMRLGELLSLTWTNVDLNKRIAYLPSTKNGTPRTVPLSMKASETLKTIPRCIDNGRVFWTWSASDSVVNVWRRTCSKAALDDLHFHDLRHEATSRFFERGLSIMEVSSITGHKTLQMLHRYTHLRTESLLEKLG